ncbi:MAG: proline--tRNA ligase [Candidatus Aureabacteria bacterium]|nr:proline--tRNA ligase [Candidatus Auribacterota bacterium]
MRWSEYFIPTLKESPQDAEIISHNYMIRAGLIYKLSSGLYNYLPLGLRVIQKVEKIIREEMSRKGAIELLMPILQPKDVWQKSGRYDVMSHIMLKARDREDREFILGPTHEEIITDLVAHKIDSYRSLPKNFYQIQAKFRDEIRPRFGVIRAREFIMKDGYSFSMTREDNEKIYQAMHDAYSAIFRRCGLKCMVIEADTGVMGGKKSHEFTATAESGEDTIVSCPSCGYAANRELAKRKLKEKSILGIKQYPVAEIHTPGLKRVEELCQFFDCEADRFIKTLIYRGKDNFYAVLIRGDLDVNENKLKSVLKDEDLVLAEPKEIKKVTGADLGYSGPVRLKNIPIIADLSVKDMVNAITGANKNDMHYKYVNIGRDFVVYDWLDIGFPQEGDLCPKCSTELEFSKGIEVGQIFELGTKYSARLSAVIQNEKGEDVPMIMGCYGIGVSRTVAAVIEQNSDEKGIIWPIEVAPFQVIVIPLDKGQCLEVAEKIYGQLCADKIETLLDDRDERAGFKFADADLIGIPIKIIIGKKVLQEGNVEIKIRRTARSAAVNPDNVLKEVKQIILADFEDLSNEKFAHMECRQVFQRIQDGETKQIKPE